ncbi:DeoR/GlpR family DNA-binding transcription regulator [Faecalicoccus pleomorphus]|uniref:Lactose phosphotransferase system repressor n=1 Tax=Faecalicoccus pleomorphus TaxID=1323 RepID=A0A380LMY0_9FIRM|nr:DeoR/GlpR family DNA-binding transcription regulator [Faecalicoccus pleomorphus]MBM6765391.1 DeoR/GlpR transcriptional regulator [Faecalicoccus pleomorphus]MBM6807623.1 DeoR/GlpR transcriptional regulator [Faecalicoccus pleomorphus]MDB7987463.1 DeoR/GlpR family DNA-binding transcription regulator [Faecalicoccus pleomorphus]MDB7991565.1 DeoR/GlpR family DNA-binding transcription regulator [Faecalicoccus pleomorphus]MDM8292804.1 DeoR/GlpR family DNA-binding transcription regulator [Faecalicoc
MNERHAKILELLSRYHKMEVSRLSTLLNVSQVTIRKDLIALEQSGMLVREHGYATLNNSDDINKRLAFHFEQKMQIVKRAAQLVEDGETIFIESGSCCALLAVEIAQTKKDVTIVTNSAFIADYVRKIENVQIVLLGGNYQKESQVMVGPMTAQCAQAYFADKLFIGTDGFSIRTGFTGNDYMRSVAVQDMAKQVEKVIVVTDSSKFYQKGNVSLIATNRIHMLITNPDIPLEQEQYLLEQKVEIIKA